VKWPGSLVKQAAEANGERDIARPYDPCSRANLDMWPRPSTSTQQRWDGQASRWFRKGWPREQARRVPKVVNVRPFVAPCAAIRAAAVGGSVSRSTLLRCPRRHAFATAITMGDGRRSIIS